MTGGDRPLKPAHPINNRGDLAEGAKLEAFTGRAEERARAGPEVPHPAEGGHPPVDGLDGPRPCKRVAAVLHRRLREKTPSSCSPGAAVVMRGVLEAAGRPRKRQAADPLYGKRGLRPGRKRWRCSPPPCGLGVSRQVVVLPILLKNAVPV